MSSRKNKKNPTRHIPNTEQVQAAKVQLAAALEFSRMEDSADRAGVRLSDLGRSLLGEALQLRLLIIKAKAKEVEIEPELYEQINKMAKELSTVFPILFKGVEFPL